MLPSINKRKFSLGIESHALTPIFDSQISANYNDSFNLYENHSRYSQEYSKNTIDIKKLQSRISRLKKDNILLKEFIKCTKVIDLSPKNNEIVLNPRSKITREFAKLEKSLFS